MSVNELEVGLKRKLRFRMGKQIQNKEEFMIRTKKKNNTKVNEKNKSEPSRCKQKHCYQQGTSHFPSKRKRGIPLKEKHSGIYMWEYKL